MSLCPLREVEAIVEHVPVIQSSTKEKPSTAAEHIRKIIDEVHPEVTTEQRMRLEELLNEYKDVLSVDEYDMGLTDLIQHDIDTGTERPVRQQLRKTPMAYHPIIEQHIQTMLKQGLIEPSRGDWASNIVLVQKKDGAFRFCIDYRAVNNKSRKEIFPLPRIDASLDALSGATWFTTLDLRSGYYQVPLNPRDAHKTSFISGCFKWRVLPMGLCNSAATFQRLMNMVLAGLNYSSCLVYLDDVIVMAATVEEHNQRLKEVLERLRMAKLKLRPDKCRVLQREVLFLGHIVTGAGIALDPKKLEVIQNWPTPQSVREVRSYIGLCAYYRKYIVGFSETAKPLHDLTKKNARFEWTESCQEAFDKLKEKLISAPVMSLTEGGFILDEMRIGAYSVRSSDGQERKSRSYLHEPNRSTRQVQEMLAVVDFVRYFKHYLLGRNFKFGREASTVGC